MVATTIVGMTASISGHKTLVPYRQTGSKRGSFGLGVGVLVVLLLKP